MNTPSKGLVNVQVGDTVFLKSGSPPMTVEYIHVLQDGCTRAFDCVWIIDSVAARYRFTEQCLETYRDSVCKAQL